MVSQSMLAPKTEMLAMGAVVLEETIAPLCNYFLKLKCCKNYLKEQSHPRIPGKMAHWQHLTQFTRRGGKPTVAKGKIDISLMKYQ